MSFISNGVVKFEDYEIDRARWQLSWRDEPLTLNRKTFDLLLYLVDHADRVVGKDELLRTLWPESFVEESNLTQHIFLLRKALSRHESGTKIIETVPGRGYRFAAVIKEPQPAADRMVISASESITRITLEEEVDTSEQAPQGLEVVQPLLSTPPGKRRTYWIAGGSVVAMVLCVAGWFGWQRWLDRSSSQPVQVILMPLDGTTGDPVLDRSLVDALRIDLSQSPFVSVVPATAVQSTLTQMHKADEPMTEAVAREVCERTNSQAVLAGKIARVGREFLLTEQASSCVDGSVIGAAKREVESTEHLPREIDGLAESLRQKLGESRRSIARFSTPLFSADTASLDALKAYSRASYDSERGKRTEAIELLKQAIAFDPNFATAYFDLSTNYRASGDHEAELAAMQKAYNLRSYVSKAVQFAIVARYNTLVTGDLFAAERNLQSWTEIYPRNATAWNNLSTVQHELGRVSEAVSSSERALELMPSNQAMYVNLAVRQLHADNPTAARSTLDRAIAKGLDGDRVRNFYMEIAYYQRDVALMQTQIAWSAAHTNSPFFFLTQAQIASAEGRLADEQRLLGKAAALYRTQGLADVADSNSRIVVVGLIESGQREAGEKLFHSLPPDPADPWYLLGLAYTGDHQGGLAGLKAMQAKYPKGTLVNLFWAPYIEAEIYLAGHRPKDAVTVLEPTRALDGRDLFLPTLRGDTFLAAGEPLRAEKEYREVLARPSLEPISANIPLAWLGLGRALAAQGNRPPAIEAYKHFLTLWAHADPDAMYLKQAKQEFATLQTATLAK
ncbi:winged helix-turn-helix domain-containing protein [Granulicella sp. L60]|uniref:winged helix-turn-helix domain-containing protein n=1 Tax=Granulicella sp. L60 TaxID=1641866 RepID=UPI00131C1A3F|nr:winged helix-turn-helix domain-containing protein [Granulicella sp. L60]